MSSRFLAEIPSAEAKELSKILQIRVVYGWGFPCHGFWILGGAFLGSTAEEVLARKELTLESVNLCRSCLFNYVRLSGTDCSECVERLRQEKAE